MNNPANWHYYIHSSRTDSQTPSLTEIALAHLNAGGTISWAGKQVPGITTPNYLLGQASRYSVASDPDEGIQLAELLIANYYHQSFAELLISSPASLEHTYYHVQVHRRSTFAYSQDDRLWSSVSPLGQVDDLFRLYQLHEYRATVELRLPAYWSQPGAFTYSHQLSKIQSHSN